MAETPRTEKKSLDPWKIGMALLIILAIFAFVAYLIWWSPAESKKGDPPVPARTTVIAPEIPANTDNVATELRFCVYTDFGYAPHARLSMFEGHYVENAAGDGYDFLLCPPDIKGKNVGLDKDQNGKEFIYFKMDTETANILGPFTAWKQVKMTKIKDGEFRYYLME